MQAFGREREREREKKRKKERIIMLRLYGDATCLFTPVINKRCLHHLDLAADRNEVHEAAVRLVGRDGLEDTLPKARNLQNERIPNFLPGRPLRWSFISCCATYQYNKKT